MSDATGTQEAGGLRDHYELLHDVGPADWIAPRLTSPPFRRVDGTVPGGFAAYARVLHPASTPDGHPVRWATVAAEQGTPWHPLVRWTDLVPESADGAGWQGREPEQGCLPPAALAALARALGPFTAEPGACLCCLWEGWGWLHGSPSVARYGSDEPVPPGLGQDVLDAPRVQLPWRDHVLFRGPLDRLDSWGSRRTPQSPSLVWPPDRSWCVATEVDHDFTLVGGSEELVEALLVADGLEAVRVEAADPLPDLLL